MPTGGSAGEYYALAQNYGNTATETNSFQYNLSTPLPGYYAGSSTYSLGSVGRWWSSTSANSYYMYNLLVNSTSVNPNSGFELSYGQSMRCLMAD